MHTKFGLSILLAVSLLSLAALHNATPAQAQAATPEVSTIQTFSTPAAMVFAYYSAVGLRNYPLAYAYWLTPSQTYTDFVNGYLTTERVEPYLGNYQPAPVGAAEVGRIPAVLFGYHTDGSVVAYRGCFFIGQSGAAWRIVNANFTLIANAFPDATTLYAYLALDCYNATSTPTPPTFGAGYPDRGQVALANYYRLINARDYTNAYAQWLQPIDGPKPNGAPASDYRLPYAQFAAGYADTVYVHTFLGTFNESGASAGHSYLDGFIPAVLISQHTDGSYTAFSGCYVLGFLSANTLGIVNGKFAPLPSTDVPNGNSILNALHNTDCTTLAIPM